MGRHEMKRQGLVPFPRVGRSGSDAYNPRFQYPDNKRSNAQTSLWFGPRLGKRAHDQGEQA